MHVHDLLNRKPTALVTVKPDAFLAAAVRLLVTHQIGALVVVDATGNLVGFLDERDVVRATHERFYSFERLHVRDVMRAAPICGPRDSVEEAMRQMTMRRQRHLVVADGHTLLGVISLGDLVKARLEQVETEAGVLRDYVAAHRASR